MSRPALRVLRAGLALVFLAVAPAARATSITLEGFGGWQHLELRPSTALTQIANSEGTGIFGGDVLLDLAGLGLGVAVDKTVSGSAQPWAGSIMGGFLIDLFSIRLEALGEIGRRARDFGDIFASNGATFVGARPGVSFRLAELPLRLGVTGLVRWPTSNGSFGSPDYGIVGKVGFEIP